MSKKISLPLIPLKDIIVFSRIVIPLFIGRSRSLKALEAASKNDDDDKLIILTTQKSADVHDPEYKDIYDVGIIGKIIQIIKLPGENVKILVETLNKIHITSLTNKAGYLSAKYNHIEEEDVSNISYLEDLCTLLAMKFSNYAKINKKINTELDAAIANQKDSETFINLIASSININIEEKQKILELNNIKDRAEVLIKLLDQENMHLETEKIVQSKLEQQIKKSQRDYYLNEQIKVIQKELGDDDKSELIEYEKKIASLKLSKEASIKAVSELKKLKVMNPMSSENGIIRNYLDNILSMPWGKLSKAKIDIKKAATILDRDHYGMQDVKTRILEYLAALERSKNLKGPILCLIGPPGVGKTSLVKSIAEATGRNYTKFSLGGVRDESEIRGHRRTYIGSMPGKIITLLKKAKTDNPIMLLDEIDKMSKDLRGDPSSAMLEVLDPEQNSHYADHN
jgi:ATP-dependent Lon protease